MAMATEADVKVQGPSAELAVKPVPSATHPALRPFQPHLYLAPKPTSSSNATRPIPTSNLLIILPGLGDGPRAYASLATNLQNVLLQTAILILRPPKPIPFLSEGPEDEKGDSPQAWWDAFDFLTGDVLPPGAQNPGACLDALGALLDYLTAAPSDSSSGSTNGGCGWPASAIHLFGYGQGGTAALEAALAWTRKQRISSSASSSSAQSDASSSSPSVELGSVVSVCGPLLSTPGGKAAPRPASIPVLSILRHPNGEDANPQATSERTKLGAAFSSPASPPQVRVFAGNEDGMLRGRAEFDVLLHFWSSSARWRNRSSWEMGGGRGGGEGGGVYAVAEVRRGD